MQRTLDFRSIGRRVAGKRVEHGLKQRDLAQMVNVSLRTISLLETGGRTNITLAVLASIGKVLGLSLDAMVYGTTELTRD